VASTKSDKRSLASTGKPPPTANGDATAPERRRSGTGRRRSGTAGSSAGPAGGSAGAERETAPNKAKRAAAREYPKAP
jgi:hypothetical protein